MATIKDVAERAGLSKTLVSRMFNNQKGVSPEARARIARAAAELNYVPNGLARSLVLQKTNTIGIVLDNLSSPFVARLISGFERGVDECDSEGVYNIIYCSSNGNIEKKQRHISYLTQGRADGILIYGSLVSDDTIIRTLSRTRFPFALIENDMDEVVAHKILIDNVDGAYAATRYLIGLGHRRIAHVAGNRNLKITMDRARGYTRALQDAGISPDPSLLVYPDFDSVSESGAGAREVWSSHTFLECGYLEMKRLLMLRNRPDAVFFASDILAFGAIRAITEAGLSVPRDISIIGFDDEKPADYDCDCDPIDTMRQALEQAGQNAMRALMTALKNPLLAPERLVLKTELIVRKSSAPRIREP